MANHKIEVGHTCGHNAILNTKDAKDEHHFKQMVKMVTMNLCKDCLREIARNQSDKGRWR